MCIHTHIYIHTYLQGYTNISVHVRKVHCKHIYKYNKGSTYEEEIVLGFGWNIKQNKVLKAQRKASQRHSCCAIHWDK